MCHYGEPVLDLCRAAVAAGHHQRLRLRRATGEPCDPQLQLRTIRPCTDVTRGQTSKIVANTFFPVNCAPGPLR